MRNSRTYVPRTPTVVWIERSMLRVGRHVQRLATYLPWRDMFVRSLGIKKTA